MSFGSYWNWRLTKSVVGLDNWGLVIFEILARRWNVALPLFDDICKVVTWTLSYCVFIYRQLSLFESFFNDIIARSRLGFVLCDFINSFILWVVRLFPHFCHFGISVNTRIVYSTLFVPLCKWGLNTLPTGCIDEATVLFWRSLFRIEWSRSLSKKLVCSILPWSWYILLFTASNDVLSKHDFWPLLESALFSFGPIV